MNGQASTVTEAAVAVDLLQSRNVLHVLTTQSTFHNEVLLQVGSDGRDLIVLQVFRSNIPIDRELSECLAGSVLANAIQVLKRNIDALLVRDINT
tara:strand:+ start:39794 stop:40078 length:285 start_codon:yes stop_codon:yes gene_type:complete